MTLHPIAIVLLCVFLVIGEAQTTTLSTNATISSNITSIQGAGASFPDSVYSVWATTFSSRTYEDVAVSYLATGSTTGITEIINGSMQFAGSDAELDDQQYALGGDLQMLPTMAGAVGIAYNVPEADAANQSIILSRQALVGIFNGTILNWNHSLIQATNNFQLPNATILVVVRKDGSGTSYIFSGALSSFDANWNSTVGTSILPKWPRQNFNASLNTGVGEYIYAIQYSIGYMDFAEVVNNNLKGAILINQAGNAVWPNSTTINSAINDFTNALSSSERFTVSISNGPSSLSYPISNWTSMELARKTLRFIWWSYTDPFAQSIVIQNQFVPLTTPVLDKVENILETFTANGTVLYGRSACDTGCAHGSCATDGAFHLPTDECVCSSGYYNVLKTDCSEPVKPVFILWNSDIALIFIGASALASLFAIFSAWFLWARRKNPIPNLILSGANEHIFVCSSQSWSFQLGMMSTLYVSNGLLLAACLLLAFKTRRVRGPFNETHMITFTVYALAVSVIVVLPVMYLPAIDLYTQFALRTAIILVCCVIATGFLLWSKIAMILFPKAADPTRGFEILPVMGQNSNVIRSVLHESGKHHKDEIENITSSRWSFDIKKDKAFNSWKHVQIILLNEYDLLLILKHQSAVDCIGAHKISACDIQFKENNLTRELQFVLMTPECNYKVESKTRGILDEFMKVFPGQVQGQLRSKTENPSTSETNLIEVNSVPSLNQSQIPADSIAPGSFTLINSPTESTRSSAPPGWSPYINTDQDAEVPHFPMCVTNAANEKSSKAPILPTTLSKPELAHHPQKNSAVPPPRPAQSAVKSSLPR
ncbi:hypothetical protein BC937DRAFT_92750 [Endogone sp. FLAS-F59071]|nr:hypothetical protein BC937DRAFT_92750 [Endogone sp. FLAS-F59071]|eukprot:RUS21415.1 hypothetical protein BC937DRAFT_92750 [Endogone sp. FLAS-F59071]